MSERHTVAARQTRSLLGLAVRLGQEPDAFAKTTDEIINDALAVHSAGVAARFALSSGESPTVAYAEARTVAQRYNAFVVECGDLAGTVLGLRFNSGLYSPVYPVS